MKMKSMFSFSLHDRNVLDEFFLALGWPESASSILFCFDFLCPATLSLRLDFRRSLESGLCSSPKETAGRVTR